jgi:hypothetical protein
MDIHDSYDAFPNHDPGPGETAAVVAEPRSEVAR